MVSVAYYRDEAERCRTLAAGTRDQAAAARWYRIAQDYENLANSLEAAPEHPPSVVRVPMQQQPVQQQQSKGAPSVLVHKSLQAGYHWRVVADGQTVESGAAATELDARNAANEAVERMIKSGPT